MAPLRSLLGIRHPILLAPMAGGLATPALVAEVTRAGGLGSIAAAYLEPEAIERFAADVRAKTDGPFAINLFAPFGPPKVDEAATAQATERLEGFRRELGIEGKKGVTASPSRFDAQFESVLRAAPKAFSFTLGMPSREHVAEARRRGLVVMGTATTLDEALALEELGVDAICAQSSEAGGHRGTFLGDPEKELVGLVALVPTIAARVPLPVIAAGGIANGRGIAAALALGASAAQIGTAFLLCPEAGTPPAYREALASPSARKTVVTRAFSGRAGRSIVNRFTETFADGVVAGFPLHQAMTRDVRDAATAQGRADLMQLWSGQAASLARAMPAGELVATLVRETRDVIAALGAEMTP